MSNIKVLTVRVPLNLNKKLEERAVREDLSKNQVVKQALRMYLDLKN
ncbi:ribbon-helix-helix protein, CopG family [Paenibacillus larvae]